jgi:hypothetical protein
MRVVRFPRLQTVNSTGITDLLDGHATQAVFEENFAYMNSFFSAAGIPEQKEEKTSKRS